MSGPRSRLPCPCAPCGERALSADAAAYVVSGCTDPSACGTYVRTTDECHCAPTYVLEHVSVALTLYRSLTGSLSSWSVGTSADCWGEGTTMFSSAPTASEPSAPSDLSYFWAGLYVSASDGTDLCGGVDCGRHGDCANGVCTCTDGYSGDRCRTAAAAQDMAVDTTDWPAAYVLEGCDDASNCGTFLRASARCTDGSAVTCGSDSTLCDNAPVYQRGGSSSAAVLYRYTDLLGTGGSRWKVGPSARLDDCRVGQYHLQSGSSMSRGEPTDYDWSYSGRSWTGITVRSSAGVDRCAGVNCGEHGTCSGGSCVCSGNFGGTFCTTCVNNYAGADCQQSCGSHGTSDGTSCTCRDGFSVCIRELPCSNSRDSLSSRSPQHFCP